MNPPVNLPIAKLLKEKGFDEPTRSIYQYDNLLLISDYEQGYKNSFNSYDWYEISAPTIAEIVMWLYEKHGIWIEVRKHTRNGLRCFSPYIDNKPVREDVFFNDYDSPTEAYEDAIEYTLNNLI